VSVVVGVIHDHEMSSLTTRCLVELARRPDVSGFIFVGGGAGRLDNARNTVARRFLAKSSPWLLTVDTDMVFSSEDFEALRSVADKDTAPIVSGAYFVDEYPPRLCAARVEDGHIRSISEWKDDEVEDVEYVGAGFMLVHRRVLLELGDQPYRQDITAPDGALVGEDYAFCTRARLAGFPVKVHTGAFIGHVKPRVLGYDI